MYVLLLEYRKYGLEICDIASWQCTCPVCVRPQVQSPDYKKKQNKAQKRKFNINATFQSLIQISDSLVIPKTFFVGVVPLYCTLQPTWCMELICHSSFISFDLEQFLLAFICSVLFFFTDTGFHCVVLELALQTRLTSNLWQFSCIYF